MNAITSKIVNFNPVDDIGLKYGNYFLSMQGEVYRCVSMRAMQLEQLPYIAEVDLSKSDDVINMTSSEIESMIVKLKSNLPYIQDENKRLKYEGYIEALNLVVSHTSVLESPWDDFIKSLIEEVN